jgi:aminoglycoside 6-adenylyltransferase
MDDRRDIGDGAAVDDEADVLTRVTRWAADQPLVRAVVLESSRAVDGAVLDAFSDYDVLLVVADVRPFADDGWLAEVGMPLVRFRDALQLQGFETLARLVLYEDYTKVDYMVWPAALLCHVVKTQRLPDLLDWGYRVLLDKDDLTVGLPAPTRRAHIPAPPSEAAYQALVEEFWWETTYVAKNLWRDDLLHARYNLDVVMKHDLLLRMLEWRVEIARDWSWKPGPVGKGLKRELPPALWSALEATFVGPDIEENWRALFATTALFRQAAVAVGEALGYAYPDALDRRVTAYLMDVRARPR